MKTLAAAMTVAVLGVAIVGSLARASDVGPFQGEAEFEYEITSEEGMDMSAIGVGGMYAFKSVDPGTGPLNEALFLARVPAAGLMLGFADMEVDMGGPKWELDGTQLGIRGGYADKNVPVSVDLEYATSSLGADVMGADVTFDQSMFELKAGYFVMPNLLVAVSYGLQNMKAEMDVPFLGTVTLIDMEQTSIGVAGKWVQELGNGGAVNVEAGFASLTQKIEGVPGEAEATAIELGGDYYLNQLIGVGVGVELLSGEGSDDDATTTEIRFKWNLNTNFGAGVSYEITNYEQSGVDDTTTFALTVTGRF